MSAPKAPKPPDPRETSAAQTGSNIGTAIANSYMNNVSQVTPDGSLTFEQTGTRTYKDAYTGQEYPIPTWTATQKFSPAGEKLNATNNVTQQNLADIGQQQSGFLKDYLGQPVDLSNEAVEGRLFELGSKRLDPAFAEREDALRTRLLNSGIREGSSAYDAATRNFNEGRNDAYNSLLLSGRGQSVQEALAARNQPLNEISALMSGSQVSTPSFVNAQQPQIPTTDNAGIINTAYNQQLQNWQQNQAQRNSLMGGLFGLGASAISLSDERVKGPMKKVGEVKGQNVYEYRYKSGGPMQLGVSAQEVEKTNPEAVVKGDDGMRRVNYRKAFGLGA